ncbi:G-protein coupled receptor 52-like [Antedon mediterranea]|uniref:G-protein coupled receptor 52-like n=1 Tax=Antedon mediterranea TaxID=105859 RepID=UPI003AF99791
MYDNYSDSINISNITNISDDSANNDFKPTRLLVSFLVLTAMILIICGNLIVITVFHYTPSLRNPNTVFITSLAIADLGVGISCLFSVYALFTGEKLNTYLCQAIGFFLTVVVGVSIMTLGCISIDRYIAVTKPLKYTYIMTKKRTRVISVCVWILSVAIFSPSLFGWGNYEFNDYTYECRLKWDIDVQFSFYVLSVLVFPNIVISSFCYYHIYKACRRQVKKHITQMENFSVDDTTGASDRESNRKVQERAVAKIFLVIVSAFYFTWLPFIIIRILEGIIPNIDIPNLVSFLTAWMGIFNSFLNCLIYSISHKSFQAGLKALLKTIKDDCIYYCRKHTAKCCNRV